MQQQDLLWEFKGSSSKSKGQIIDLLVEFLITHLTILSFISLTGIISSQFEFLSKSIILLVSVFAYLILSDVFIVFLARYNLSYSISDKGLIYNWGILKPRQVFIPFEEIESISIVDHPKLKRKAIEFRTSTKITNGSLGIEIGALSYVLSFERLDDLEPAIDILKAHYEGPIKVRPAQKTKNLFYRFSKSNIYHKLNLFLAFSFIYLASFIAINIFDNNVATQQQIEDTVVSEKKFRGQFGPYNNLQTSKGHSITLHTTHTYLDREIKFTKSPIYDRTSSFDSFKQPDSESLKNGYVSNDLIMKVFCFLILLFFAIYIIYKRGNLYREDYIVIIFGPILISLVGGFILYH